MPDIKHIAVGGVTYDIPTGGGQVMTATVKYDSTSTMKISNDFTIDNLLDLNVGDLVVINPDTENDIYAFFGYFTMADTNEYKFEFVDTSFYILPAMFTVVETYTEYNRKVKVLRYLATGNTAHIPPSIIHPYLSELADSISTIEDVVLTLLLRYKYGSLMYSTEDSSLNYDLLPYDSSGNVVTPDESAYFVHDSFVYTIYKYHTAPTNISYFSYNNDTDYYNISVILPLLFDRVGKNGNTRGSWPMIVGSPKDRYTVSDPSILNNNQILIVKSLISEANYPNEGY